MKKRLAVVVAVMCAVCSMGLCCGFAKASELPSRLVVTGVGRTHAEPDVAEMTFCVEACEKDGDDVKKALAQTVKDVRAAIAKIDASAEQSITECTQIARPLARRAMFVSQTQCYRLRTKPSHVKKIEEAIVNAGAVHCAPPCYKLENMSAAYKKALELAIEDARSKVDAKQGYVLHSAKEKRIVQYVAPHADGLIAVEARVEVRFERGDAVTQKGEQE